MMMNSDCEWGGDNRIKWEKTTRKNHAEAIWESDDGGCCGCLSLLLLLNIWLDWGAPMRLGKQVHGDASVGNIVDVFRDDQMNESTAMMVRCHSLFCGRAPPFFDYHCLEKFDPPTDETPPNNMLPSSHPSWAGSSRKAALESSWSGRTWTLVVDKPICWLHGPWGWDDCSFILYHA